MKKLLSIFGAMALTTTASTSVIACGNPQEKQDLEKLNKELKDEKDKLEKLNKELKDEKDKLEKLNKELKDKKAQLENKLWTIYREIEYIPDSAFSKNITIQIGKYKDITLIKESDLNVALPLKIKEELNKFHKDIGENDFRLSYSCFGWQKETINLTNYEPVEVRIRGQNNKIKGEKTVKIFLKAITKTS